jgi:hypothetical protein
MVLCEGTTHAATHTLSSPQTARLMRGSRTLSFRPAMTPTNLNPYFCFARRQSSPTDQSLLADVFARTDTIIGASVDDADGLSDRCAPSCCRVARNGRAPLGPSPARFLSLSEGSGHRGEMDVAFLCQSIVGEKHVMPCIAIRWEE